jgi:hypothetical protein
MKHSYLHIFQLVSVFLFSTVCLNAQEYHPFPTKNTVWAEVFHPSGGYYPNIYHFFALKDNDTIIKGNQYHKLYFSYDTLFTENKICGGLREENKRVYYYSIDSLTCAYLPIPVDTEIVLYDFNLKQGDTIKRPEFRIRIPGKLVVLKTDSILIDDRYRERYNFGDIYNVMINDAKWVEGIGCLRGLLADIGYTFNNDLVSNLICFIQDNKVLYHDYHPDCYYKNPVSVQSLNNDLKIKIFPNPAGSSTRIEFEKPEYQKLVISDQSGKKMKEYNLEGKQSFVINKGELPDGMYLLSVYDKAGTIQTLKMLFKE